LLTPAQTLTGMWVIFGLTGLLGLYLATVAGWPVILIGLAAIAAAILYTGGPLPFGYYGLGDLFVFIFFGLAAVGGTYYVQAGQLSAAAVWAAVPIGLLTTAILVVNNLRDIETDRAVGKRTLAVRLGVRGARLEYLLCLGVAYLAVLLMWAGGLASAWVMLSWLSLPLALRLVRQIYRDTGRALNLALAGTGQFELVFAVLFSIGLWI
jgi:1,4-dihydroxy-2-naphthoate octaprenyltransferase